MRRDTAELLAAYVDGVGELSPSERRRVELYLADDQSARRDETAARELIGKLRELPPQSEPDWTALERSIQEAVGHEVPRPWWRRWRFAAPAVLALAGATGLAVFVLRGTPDEVGPDPIVRVPVAPEIDKAPDDETVAVYLDGTDLELAIETAEAAGDKLDELTFAGFESLANTETLRDTSVRIDATENLLGDLGWVDELDEAELVRLERLLDRKRKGS